ncbi:MAG TPA: twin-arginine translocase subunit TatC [Solirubrobacteraceae bacterium]|nr:twin-arginine translocase subunit TatC [Solirubrobacteraceae bacterium]
MASTVLRPIGHEDRMSLVDHLGELRTRLIVCVLALMVAFGIAFWQEDLVLEILNGPLAASSQGEGNPLGGAGVAQRELSEALGALASALGGVRGTLTATVDPQNLDAAARAQVDRSLAQLNVAQAQLAEAARASPGLNERQPITTGVAEPFTVTLAVSFYAALLLAMPVLLYQLYAFILPAFSPTERRVALPLMLAIPVLFVAGVLFAYFVVLARAVDFLQNFNDDNFDVLVQARDYYRFSVLFMAAIGFLFQIPVAVLAVVRTGIATPRQLRRWRGYVLLGIALLAAIATPTPDPITRLLAMGPLGVLYELSILRVTSLERIRPTDAERVESAESSDREP